MASGGLVFLLWSARGRAVFLGLFPNGASACPRAVQTNNLVSSWIEAPTIRSDHRSERGAVCGQRNSYNELSRTRADEFGQADGGAVTLTRLFGANRGLARPCLHRLSKRQAPDLPRREVLRHHDRRGPVCQAQFELAYRRCRGQRVLWRIAVIAGQQGSDRCIGPEIPLCPKTPRMGFFAARPDGTNHLSQFLAARRCSGPAPETAKKSVRRTIMAHPEFVKMLARDRKTGAPGRGRHPRLRRA